MNRREFLEALAAGVAATKGIVSAVTPKTAALKGQPSETSRQLMAPVRVNPLLRHSRELRMALDGTWQFRLDPNDVGLARNGTGDPLIFTDTVQVPGCWQGQGFGNDEPG